MLAVRKQGFERHCCYQKACAYNLKQGFSTFLLPCTPSAFRQMHMYPKISYDNTFYYDYFTDIFNNRHMMIFQKNIH